MSGAAELKEEEEGRKPSSIWLIELSLSFPLLHPNPIRAKTPSHASLPASPAAPNPSRRLDPQHRDESECLERARREERVDSQKGRLATVVKALSERLRQSYPPWKAPRFSICVMARPVGVKTGREEEEEGRDDKEKGQLDELV